MTCTAENGAGNVTLEFARNAAMKPLRQLRAGKGRSALHTDSKPHFAADYIALVEHGFPCASDIIRLLLSKADLACGLDFQTHEVCLSASECLPLPIAASLA